MILLKDVNLNNRLNSLLKCFPKTTGHFAGKLIQDSNLQGYRIGGVEVSTKHAGFMVNVDNGTATDYEALIHHVQKIVKEKFDVELNTEVRIIGASSHRLILQGGHIIGKGLWITHR